LQICLNRCVTEFPCICLLIKYRNVKLVLILCCKYVITTYLQHVLANCLARLLSLQKKLVDFYFKILILVALNLKEKIQAYSHAFDDHGSVHRNIKLIERTNKMQPCSRIYYSNVSYLLNMFRATHRPLSGVQKL